MESGPRRDSPIVEPPPDRHSPPDEEAAQVMSENHLGVLLATVAPTCPVSSSLSHLLLQVSGDSLWTENDDAVDEDMTLSSGACDLDENGDLVLTQRKKAQKDHFVVNIRHNITSSITRFGLQLWRAELVLADFKLHNMFTSWELDGCVALELGAGTDLPFFCMISGKLLARGAHTIFITGAIFGIGEVLQVQS